MLTSFSCYITETFYVIYIVLMEHGIFLKATYNTHFCVCVLPGVNKTMTLMLFLKLQTVVSPFLRCFLVNLWPPPDGIITGRFRAVVLDLWNGRTRRISDIYIMILNSRKMAVMK